jgi:hypothetical protein
VDFVSPFQQYPDVGKMGPAQVEEFVRKSDLAEWQKSELLAGDDKTNRYVKMIFWHNLNKVHASYANFHNYLLKNGIFIQAELYEKMKALSGAMSEAIHERQFEEEYPNPRPERFEKGDRLRKEGQPMMQDIEAQLKTRLWNARSLD